MRKLACYLEICSSVINNQRLEGGGKLVDGSVAASSYVRARPSVNMVTLILRDTDYGNDILMTAISLISGYFSSL